MYRIPLDFCCKTFLLVHHPRLEPQNHLNSTQFNLPTKTDRCKPLPTHTYHFPIATMPGSYDTHSTADMLVKAYHNEIKGKVILTTGVSPNGLGAFSSSTLLQPTPSSSYLLAATSPRSKPQPMLSLKPIPMSRHVPYNSISSLSTRLMELLQRSTAGPTYRISMCL